MTTVLPLAVLDGPWDHAVVGVRPVPRALTRQGLYVGCAAAVLLAAAELTLAIHVASTPATLYVSDVLFPLAWTTLGLLAWYRGSVHPGRLMVLVGVVYFAQATGAFHPPTDLPLRALITFVTAYTFWLQYAAGAHLLLTYPTGVLRERGEHVLVRLWYGSAAVLGTLVVLTRTPDPAQCGDHCHVNPLAVVHDVGVSVFVRASGQAWVALLAIVSLAYSVRRYRTAGPRARRRQRLQLAAAGGAVLTLIAFFVMFNIAPSQESAYPLATAAGYVFLLAVPGSLFVGLILDRLHYATVGDLVRKLDGADPDDVEALLAEAMGDPELRVLFPQGDDLVDVQGREVSIGAAPGRQLTTITSGDTTLAVLVHEPELSEVPGMLEAVGSAARLVLDNARLRAEVRTQLAQVRASRGRIVAAADEERRRLERDLHDGAQQHLLGIGMTLQLLRAQTAGDRVDSALLDEADAELKAAIGELRALSQGLHPAVLVDEGLPSALGMLARRSSIPVTLDLRTRARFSATVESAVYFIASEAIQNAVKHSGASLIAVELDVTDGRLVLVVRDDGSGLADSTGGTGLRGLVDRAEALDGTLTVSASPGAGTTITARLPCA